jgi:hypothetical protein
LQQNKTDELLTHIHDYQRLLGFLDSEFPQVLEKWKYKVAVATNHSITTTTNGQDGSDQI